MSLELYFLRSSEQKIVTDMLGHLYGVSELKDFQQLSIYNDFYGLTAKDLGLYALNEAKISGAIWTRRLNKEHNSNAFVDENTPVLTMVVLEEFRGEGIGSSMMDQFLQEAATLYEQISVSVRVDSKEMAFYEKYGFEIIKESHTKSYVSDENVITMLKKLEKKEIVRPSDGYDPRRWMD